MDPKQTQDISIADLDKAAVLTALYNNSKLQGLGFLQAETADMSIEEARELLKSSTYFDYLHGKVMKVNLEGDTLNPWAYNRDNGAGAAERVIEHLRGNPEATGHIPTATSDTSNSLNTEGNFSNTFRPERHKERIELEDSLQSAMAKLARDDVAHGVPGTFSVPGALICLTELVATATDIDPDSMWGSLSPLIDLDSSGVYGSGIWKLHHEIAERNALLTHAVLRATQLGILPRTELHAAIAGKGTLNLEDLLQAVQERLPAFGQDVSQ